MKVETTENIYEMTTKSSMIYCIELWRVCDAWMEIAKFHHRFCKKILEIP